MGQTNQERINLATKTLAAGVIDANSVGVWYESRFPFQFILEADAVWTDIGTLRTLPAANLAAAQANAALFPALIEDRSAFADAIRLTPVPGTNSSTFVSYETYNDPSTWLRNWLLPQLVPQASGAPSNGYSIRLYNGDPNLGGTIVSTTDGTTGTGTAKSVGWIFNYASGLLLLSDDFYTLTSLTPATFDPYIVGFRYVGNSVAASTNFINLSDTPLTYVGQARRLVSVNALESAVEFVDGLYRLADLAAANAETGALGNLIYVESLQTFYEYVDNGALIVDSTTILDTGDGGTTRWLGVAGQYSVFSTPSDRILDSDSDTSITVELAADEDVIRFNLGDTPGFGPFTDVLTLDSANGFVWNQNADDLDFSISTTGVAAAVYVDSANDVIGFGAVPVAGSFLQITSPTAGAISINPFGAAAGNTGELRFLELAANGTDYVGVKAPDSIAVPVIWTLPSADASGALVSNGLGILSFQALSSISDADGDTSVVLELAADDDTIRFNLGDTPGFGPFTDVLTIDSASGFSFNQNQDDLDFVVATTGLASALSIDSANNVIGLGAAPSPGTGLLQITPAAAPAVSLNPFGAAAGNTSEIRFLELVANGTDYVGFKAPDLISAPVIWTLPSVDGATGTVLSTNGTGTLSFSSISSVQDADGDTSITVEAAVDEDIIRLNLGDTPGFGPFTDVLTLGSASGFSFNQNQDDLDFVISTTGLASGVFVDAALDVVGVGSAPTAGTALVQLSPVSAPALALLPFGVAAGNTSEIRFFELSANGTDYVGFKSPDLLAAPVTWTLPDADGLAGSVLTTNGTAGLSFSPVPTPTLIQDADADTSITVELAADEDVIRFNLGDTPGFGPFTNVLTLDSANGFRWNTAQEDLDFRISSDNIANAFLVNAALDRLETAAEFFYTPSSFGLGTNTTINSGNEAWAIGNNAAASGFGSITIGFNASGGGAIAPGTVSIGRGASAPGSGNVALGDTSVAGSQNTVALGLQAQSTNIQSISLGASTLSSGDRSIAVGAFAQATAASTQAYGRSAVAAFADSVAIGRTATTTTTNQLMIGADLVPLDTEINGTLLIDPGSAAALTIDPFGVAAGETGEIRFRELVANGTDYVGFKAPDLLATPVIWTLPSVDGAAGTVLSTDGAGVLSFSSVSSLQDADGDTSITVEAAADEDIIRFNLGDTPGFGPFTDVLTVGSATGFVFNSAQDDLDLSASSTNIVGILTVDSGLDKVGVGGPPSAGTHVFQVTGDQVITGNLVVQGTTTSINSEIVNTADNHLYLNSGYTTAVAQTGGLVVNYLPTVTTDTSGGVAAFTAGVPAVSNPTVATVAASVFTAGDLVQISGATDPENNGLFEVDSHAANLLTLRGVGTIGSTVDFVQTDLVSGDGPATITLVNVSILRAGTDSLWEVATGSSTTGLVFSDLVSGDVTSIADADADTSITVDAAADEDIIRFNLGDTPGFGPFTDVLTVASSTGFLFNQNQDDLDFVVSTTGLASAISVDSANDVIGFGAAATAGSGLVQVTPASAPAITLAPFGVAAGETSEIRFLELAANGTDYVGFKSPDLLAAPVIWTLPDADAAGTLISDGAGNLSFSAAGGGLLGTVQTVDATPTTLYTFALAADGVAMIEATILGRVNGGGNTACYKRTARVTTVAGTSTVNLVQTDFTSEDDPLWDVQIITIGVNAVIQVTGVAATTIDWSSSSTVTELV